MRKLLFLLPLFAVATCSRSAELDTAPDYATCGTCANGLTGFWRLDEGTGTTAADASGNGNTITLPASPNTPAWQATASCISGSCLSFDGNAKHASRALNFSTTNVITVAFWLKWNAYANDDRLAMEFSPNFNNVTTGFMIDPNSSAAGGGKFEVGLKGNVGFNQVVFTRPSAGVWHHIAVVFDKNAPASTEVTPYVDGLAVSYTKPTNSENTNTFGSDTLYLMSRAGLSLFGTGSLDGVRIYNRALTTTEIQALAAPPATGQTALWKLDEGTGTSTQDASGNGYTITFPASPANPTWSTSCVAGTCLSFDGVSKYASTPQTLSFTKVITVAFWLKWNTYANDDRLAMEFSPNFNNVTTGFMFDPNSSAAGGGKFEVGLKGDVGFNQAVFNRPSAGVWHHIAVVFDKGAAAASEVTPYVDGVAVSYTKPTNAENTNSFGVDSLYVMSRAGASLFGAGSLDEVQTFGRALSATEIQALATVSSPTITTSSLPNGTTGTAYSTTLAAMGGTPPYTWSIISGSLPAGLTLGSTNGVISGTPTTAGTSNFTVQVTDAAAHTGTRALSIVVNNPAGCTGSAVAYTVINTGSETRPSTSGGSYIDTQFGANAKVIRVTTNGNSMHSYAYDGIFSITRADGQKNFLVYDGSTSTLKLWRINTSTDALTLVGNAFGSNSVGCNWEQANFSHTNPDLLYCLSTTGKKLYTTVAGSGTFTVLKDFTALLNQPGESGAYQLAIDKNDDAFTFHTRNSSGARLRAVAWDRSDDSTFIADYTGLNLDETHMDKNGTYVTVIGGGGATSVFKYWNFRTGTVVTANPNSTEKGGLGHVITGSGYEYGGDAWLTGWYKRNLASPLSPVNLARYCTAGSTPQNCTVHWEFAEHLTINQSDERFFIATMYDGDASSAVNLPWEDEIVAMATDGTWLKRLAHHHSVVNGDYWNQPRSSVSYDGQYIIFTSNYDNLGRDVYLLKPGTICN